MKRLLHSFYFLEVKRIRINLSIFIFRGHSFIEIIFKIKLIPLVTKDMDTSTFNFAHTINPRCHTIPLYIYCRMTTFELKKLFIILIDDDYNKTLTI